ncbi:non-homologous end joining protein Ku [Glycomyces rhizosphaerae]|uniref:Non-homologous end joining protein Ku n=1 Tax=Glycomyces rhizosphaerae TaxID=2054422 RepID=A0ABV7Q867_9ACTN
MSSHHKSHAYGYPECHAGIMARSIWNGAIAFGLVNIPIQLQVATSSHEVPLHNYHAPDLGRIHLQKVCEIEDEPVPPEELVKGWESEDDKVVVLEESDFEDLPVSTSKLVEVLQFVKAEEIDPIHFDKSYYAQPGKFAERAYVLLREAMINSGRIAVVKIALRRRECLAVIRPHDGVLVLHTMLWPDEVRKPEISGIEGEAAAQELEMADTLIDSMSGTYEPEKYSDAYQEAMEDLIKAKLRGRKLPKAKAKAQPKAEVINLMDALQKSLDRAGSPRKRPAKKAAPRKAAAKKATARKQPAKKSATRNRKSA